MASKDEPVPLPDRDLQFQQYFTALAPNYHHLTSNTTYLIAQKALALAPIPKDPSALINDNACGPGTATLAIIAQCKASATPIPNIIATDYTPTMINTLQEHLIKSDYQQNVQASVQDSQALPYPSNHFDYTICNISLANFNNTSLALHELFRTSKPSAATVITHWKLFALGDLLHRALEIFKDAPQPSPPVAGKELMKEGVIAGMMVEAGWEREQVETFAVEVKSEDLEGAVEFLTGPFLPVVKGMEEGEKARWREACWEALREAGSVRCEGWVVVGTKGGMV